MSVISDLGQEEDRSFDRGRSFGNADVGNFGDVSACFEYGDGWTAADCCPRGRLTHAQNPTELGELGWVDCSYFEERYIQRALILRRKSVGTGFH